MIPYIPYFAKYDELEWVEGHRHLRGRRLACVGLTAISTSDVYIHYDTGNNINVKSSYWDYFSCTSGSPDSCSIYTPSSYSSTYGLTWTGSGRIRVSSTTYTTPYENL